MKILLTIAALLLLTGCGSIINKLPDGHADTLRYTRTGKFSSTTVEAIGFAKTPEAVTADRLTVKHANAWIPNIEFTAERFERRSGK